MENQDKYIPEHIQGRWDDCASELAAVAMQRHDTEESYREMINQQLSMPEASEFPPDTYEVAQQLAELNHRYNQLILARLALSSELKQWQMQTYFNHSAA